MAMRASLNSLRRSRVAFGLNQRRLRIESHPLMPAGSLRGARGRSELTVALSYDDGPSPANTPDLLDMLAGAGAHATFFVVGSEVVRYPALAARIAAEGHELGNHSYSHAHPRGLGDIELRREVERGARAIADAAAEPRLYRPPFGKRARAATTICAQLGYTSVLWSIDSGDTMNFSAARISDEVVSRVEAGDIVLLHDGGSRRQRTLDATESVVNRLSARGYHFVTVSELLGITPSRLVERIDLST